MNLAGKILRYVRVHGHLPGWENFRRRRRPGMPLPLRLQIEPTTLCDLCCVSCPNKDLPDSRRARSMSFGFFKSLVEQVPRLREIKLQGLGEPLLTPDLYKMLEWGRERGICFDIITNGTLVHRHVKRILPLLARFAVSFDALTEETAQKLRSRVNVELLKRNVAAMVEEKRATDSQCNVGITCVVSKENAQEVEAIMGFGQATGVDSVGFVAVENWKMPCEPGYEKSKRFVEDSLPSSDMERIGAIYQKGGYAFSLGLQDAAPRKGNCYWGFSSVFITCDGFVTPCCVRPNPAAIHFGNLHEQSFRSIWNGPDMREFRRTHIEGFPNPVCDTCPR